MLSCLQNCITLDYLHNVVVLPQQIRHLHLYSSNKKHRNFLHSLLLHLHQYYILPSPPKVSSTVLLQPSLLFAFAQFCNYMWPFCWEFHLWFPDLQQLSKIPYNIIYDPQSCSFLIFMFLPVPSSPQFPQNHARNCKVVRLFSSFYFSIPPSQNCSPQSQTVNMNTFIRRKIGPSPISLVRILEYMRKCLHFWGITTPALRWPLHPHLIIVSSTGILLFHSLHMKKLILKGTPFTHIFLKMFSIPSLFLIYCQVDLTVNNPLESILHIGQSSSIPIGGMILVRT